MTQPEYRQHWNEGTKYALEGMKTLFILNGASAVSVLTFVGNAEQPSSCLVVALLAFAGGSLFGFLSMLGAYLSELNYGNAERLDRILDAHEQKRRMATNCHYATYAFVLLGICCFVTGVVLVAFGLWPVS